MLPPALVVELAHKLYQARKDRTQLRHFSKDHPHMTLEDGYAIQREWVKLELADGHSIKGRKIGLTSRAMQQASQITEPDYAPLMEDMFFENGTDIPIERFIAPRVEVELAFVLRQPLRSRRPLTSLRPSRSSTRASSSSTVTPRRHARYSTLLRTSPPMPGSCRVTDRCARRVSTFAGWARCCTRTRSSRKPASQPVC